MLAQLTIIAGDLVQIGQWAEISELQMEGGVKMYEKFGAGNADSKSYPGEVRSIGVFKTSDLVFKSACIRGKIKHFYLQFVVHWE